MEPAEEGTIAAFATMLPPKELRVDTNGCNWPAGQKVRYPSGAGGTTVAFSESATLDCEIEQSEPPTGTVRITPPASDGPPSRPMAFRGSIARHGVRG